MMPLGMSMTASSSQQHHCTRQRRQPTSSTGWQHRSHARRQQRLSAGLKPGAWLVLLLSTSCALTLAQDVPETLYEHCSSVAKAEYGEL